MEFKVDIDDILDGLDDVDEKVMAALELYGETVALKAEGKSKSEAKWTDRTGAARQSLKGTSNRNHNNVRVTLSHNVFYGIYLEYCNGGKYAIVEPTIDAISGEAIEGLKNLLK